MDLGENLSWNCLTVNILNSSNHLYSPELEGNGLCSVNLSMFKPVAKLQVLNLSHNQLSKLDEVQMYICFTAKTRYTESNKDIPRYYIDYDRTSYLEEELWCIQDS